jgi:hypothetical protein
MPALDALTARTDVIADAASATEYRGGEMRIMRKRLQRHTARLVTAIDACSTLYAPERMHAVRIAGLPLMLYEGPQNQVLSILIWNMWDEGYVPAVAAIGTLLMLALLLLTLAVRYIGFRRQVVQAPNL